MEITIRKKKFDFQPPEYKEWQVKRNDPFTFLKIGNTDCFVKSFAQQPSGWGLMQALKGVETDGNGTNSSARLPVVFGAFEVVQDGQIIYYLILERLEGLTLKEHVMRNKAFNAAGLFEDIFKALKFLHDRGYWFGDLNEENIFCTDSGRYYLIDIDSCWPHQTWPCADTSAPGGLPGHAQEYAGIVLDFYRKILRHQHFTFDRLTGKNLNQLQLLALAAKFRLLCELGSPGEYNDIYGQALNKEAILEALYEANKKYSTAVFSAALGESVLISQRLPAAVDSDDYLHYGAVEMLGEFVSGKRKITQRQLLPPEIAFFRASSSSVIKGGTVTFTWQVVHADDLWLEAAGFSKNITGEQSVAIIPGNTTIYTLMANNGAGDTQKADVLITVTEPAKPVPTIPKQKPAGVAWKKWAWGIAAVLAIITVAQWFIYSDYSQLVRNGDVYLSRRSYNNAIIEYSGAKVKGKLLIFGKQDVDEKQSEAYYGQDKEAGDSLYAKGVYIDTVEYGYSALARYREASLFYPGTDTLIMRRIELCELVGKASADAANGDFEQAYNGFSTALQHDSTQFLQDSLLIYQRKLFPGRWQLSVTRDINSDTFDLRTYTTGGYTLDRALNTAYNGTWQIERAKNGMIYVVFRPSEGDNFYMWLTGTQGSYRDGTGITYQGARR